MKTIAEINEIANKFSLVANDETVAKLPKFIGEIAYLRECIDANNSQRGFLRQQLQQVEAQADALRKALDRAQESDKQTRRLIEILEKL